MGASEGNLTHSSKGKFESCQVGSLRFIVVKPSDLFRWLLHEVIPRSQQLTIRFANSYNVALAESDENYRKITLSGINVADGWPIAWVMRKLGFPAARQLRGPDFFRHMLGIRTKSRIKHLFIGSTEEVLEKIQRVALAQNPQFACVATYSPPFELDLETLAAKCASLVKETSPDIVWLGLGTPKQDFLAFALEDYFQGLTICVGAAFDFYAGAKQEAPLFVRKLGLEWFFRLLQEPRRLGKRYLLGNLHFIGSVTRQILRNR